MYVTIVIYNLLSYYSDALKFRKHDSNLLVLLFNKRISTPIKKLHDLTNKKYYSPKVNFS